MTPNLPQAVLAYIAYQLIISESTTNTPGYLQTRKLCEPQEYICWLKQLVLMDLMFALHICQLHLYHQLVLTWSLMDVRSPRIIASSYVHSEEIQCMNSQNGPWCGTEDDHDGQKTHSKTKLWSTSMCRCTHNTSNLPQTHKNSISVLSTRQDFRQKPHSGPSRTSFPSGLAKCLGFQCLMSLKN